MPRAPPFPTDPHHAHTRPATAPAEPRVRARTLTASQRPPKLSLDTFERRPLAGPYAMNLDPARFSPPACDLLPDDPFADLSSGPELVAFAARTHSFASLVSPSMSTVTLQAFPRSCTPTPALSRCSTIEDSPGPKTPRNFVSSVYTSESDSIPLPPLPPPSEHPLRTVLKSSPSTISLKSLVKSGKGRLLRKKAKKTTARPVSPPDSCNRSVWSSGSDDTDELSSVHSRDSSYTVRLPWLNRIMSRPATREARKPEPQVPLLIRMQEEAPTVQLRPISRFDVDFDVERRG